MVNAQRPKRQTKHVELKHFSLLQWRETDQIILAVISTTDNATDGVIKPLVTIFLDVTGQRFLNFHALEVTFYLNITFTT